ncbi:MAG: Maf family protein [Mariprofundaceae bacterium]|nr:Maf family protein [Mariprofundaceae bacterium]
MSTPSVVLASASPRRLQLLLAAGLAVEALPVDTDEQALAGESVRQMVCRLAREKAFASPVQERPLIAADTMVCLHKQALGKPVDLDDARRMLHDLADNTHHVLTGVCVRWGDLVLQDVVQTEVHFRPINDDEINVYLAHNDVMDKAGAYALQGGAATFVDRVDGTLDNVIGLPVTTTLQLLDDIIQQHQGKKPS